MGKVLTLWRWVSKEGGCDIHISNWKRCYELLFSLDELQQMLFPSD